MTPDLLRQYQTVVEQLVRVWGVCSRALGPEALSITQHDVDRLCGQLVALVDQAQEALTAEAMARLEASLAARRRDVKTARLRRRGWECAYRACRRWIPHERRVPDGDGYCSRSCLASAQTVARRKGDLVPTGQVARERADLWVPHVQRFHPTRICALPGCRCPLTHEQVRTGVRYHSPACGRLGVVASRHQRDLWIAQRRHA